MEFRYTTTPKNICFDILSNHHQPFSGKNSETEGRLRGNDERIQCVLATNETMQVLQFLLRVGKCHGNQNILDLKLFFRTRTKIWTKMCSFTKNFSDVSLCTQILVLKLNNLITRLLCLVEQMKFSVSLALAPTYQPNQT